MEWFLAWGGDSDGMARWRVGVKAEKTHAPRTGAMGHPPVGVVGLGSLGEFELAIRVFAKNKFKKESLGTRPSAF